MLYHSIVVTYAIIYYITVWYIIVLCASGRGEGSDRLKRLMETVSKVLGGRLRALEP